MTIKQLLVCNKTTLLLFLPSELLRLLWCKHENFSLSLFHFFFSDSVKVLYFMYETYLLIAKEKLSLQMVISLIIHSNLSVFIQQKESLVHYIIDNTVFLVFLTTNYMNCTSAVKNSIYTIQHCFFLFFFSWLCFFVHLFLHDPYRLQ